MRCVFKKWKCFSKNDIKNSVKPVVTPSPARRRYQLPHQLDWIWLVTWPLTRFFFLKISLFLIFYSKLGRFFLWSQHHLLCFVAALHLCHYQNSTYESVCMLCFLLGVFKHCFFFIFGGVVAFNVIGFLKKHFLFIKCSCERQQHCIGVSHSFPYSLWQ